MNSWAKGIKFKFRNAKDTHIMYEVCVPDIRDNEDTNVEDCYHTMGRYDLLW